jgi:hypothetical protein
LIKYFHNKNLNLKKSEHVSNVETI